MFTCIVFESVLGVVAGQYLFIICEVLLATRAVWDCVTKRSIPILSLPVEIQDVVICDEFVIRWQFVADQVVVNRARIEEPLTPEGINFFSF